MNIKYFRIKNTISVTAVIFTLLLSINSYSQVLIQGKITDKSNQAITNASVMIMRASDSTIVTYCFTDINGGYFFNINQKEKELLIMVSGFNIPPQYKKITNKSQKLDISVLEKAIELKEFSIEAKKIWGTRDTINYLVRFFMDSTDLVIGDVLNKMPGIEVRDNGEIKYQGKAII